MPNPIYTLKFTGSSVMIRRVAILSPRLPVMASLAQRLAVRSVPEELRVSSVRNDVIHNRCRSCNTLLQALLTEWMELQELLALSSPTAVVSFRGSGSCSLRLHLLVFLTVLLPCRDEVRAPRMPAGNLWCVWHRLFTRLLICKRKAPADQADAPQNSFYKIQLS